MDTKTIFEKWFQIYNLAKKAGFKTARALQMNFYLYDIEKFDDAIKHLKKLANENESQK